ncbi:MAG TPA: hypothetical protein DCZ51_11775 [Bacteroidales bacterium]|nr:hypothetical protein [Bacteroidales bacterium]
MPELSLQNIERISRDVKRQEIIFSHLADDLIDHICCDVENAMEDGLTFYEAYMKVKQKMNPRRLKEIQEETLYAIDTKYRNMKNTMKISGVAGATLFGLAALFKIQHWPGAGFMMSLGALLLTFVFMPSALGVLWKESHNKNKLFLFISAFLSMGFFIFGILFKVQHWQGAAIVLILAGIFGILFFMPSLVISLFRDEENKNKRGVYILGAAGLILYLAGLFMRIQHWAGGTACTILGLAIIGTIALPWFTWLTWKDEKYVTPRFLFLIIGSLAILISGALVNLSTQYSYEDGFYSNMEQQQILYKYLYRNNNSLAVGNHDSLSFPHIEQLHSRTTGLVSFISSIEVKMVQESEGKPGEPAEAENQISQSEYGQEINYRLLSNPFPLAPVNDFLMPGSRKRQELDKELNDYLNFISELARDNELKESLELIRTSDLLPGKNTEDRKISLISGLHSLELLKNNLLIIELKLLSGAANR